MFPCFQNLSQEVYDLLCKSHKPISTSLRHPTRSSTIAEYDLGGEGDLFKALEPIIEDIMGIDPMTTAISMMSAGQDVILPQWLKVSDRVSLETEPLFSDVYYECGEDLMEKEALLDEAILESKILTWTIDEKEPLKDEMPVDMPFAGTPYVSSECLNSLDWMQGAPTKPSFLDFPVLDFGADYGMRRAFSEGDIKTLTNGNEKPTIVGNCTMEERREKLSRYRNKKTKRNFGRKIKVISRPGRHLQTVNPGSEVDLRGRKKWKPFARGHSDWPQDHRTPPYVEGVLINKSYKRSTNPLGVPAE